MKGESEFHKFARLYHEANCPDYECPLCGGKVGLDIREVTVSMGPPWICKDQIIVRCLNWENCDGEWLTPSGPGDEIAERQRDKLRKHNDAIASGQTHNEGGKVMGEDKKSCKNCGWNGQGGCSNPYCDGSEEDMGHINGWGWIPEEGDGDGKPEKH